MKRIAISALVATILVLVIGLFVIWHKAANIDSTLPIQDRIQYLKLYLDLAKALGVGLGAALLSILLPAFFAEARYQFERLKDSRTAYGEAKTGIEYLPLRICALDLNAAAALMQQEHIKKHKAELYAELKMHLKHRKINRTPGQWGDEIYGRLFLIRNFLESHANVWDSRSPGERLTMLRKVLKAPEMESLENGSFGVPDWECHSSPEERFALLKKKLAPNHEHE